MRTFTEGRYPGEAVASEGNGTISREIVTIAAGQNLGANTVLGKVTATGQYRRVNPAANDGTETAVATLVGRVDATDAAAKGVAIVRDAELRASDLDFGTLTAPQIAAAKAQLRAAGLIVREGV